MVKAKIFIFKNYFKNYPKESDFELIEKELPPIKNGEFLAEAVYLSVDPYMRAYSVRLPLGIPFIGSSVAKILESKNPDFPIGRYVVGNFDWQSHVISNGKAAKGHLFTQEPYLLPDLGSIPVSTGLGLLGMTGNTAYFGVKEVLKPQPGETVVVSGAAGAVGNVVGQLVKLQGCKVIGIVGSQEKGDFLVNDLGLNHFINYKNENFDEALKKVAPGGIDCYFDNVGGDISYSVMKQMNIFGRIAVCGAISGYNEQHPKRFLTFAGDWELLLPTLRYHIEGEIQRVHSKAFSVPSPQTVIVFKQLRIQGLHVHQWLDRWDEGILNNLKLIQEGKLKYKETITEGFENMYKAFLKMLKGDNIGKAIVKT